MRDGRFGTQEHPHRDEIPRFHRLRVGTISRRRKETQIFGVTLGKGGQHRGHLAELGTMLTVGVLRKRNSFNCRNRR